MDGDVDRAEANRLVFDSVADTYDDLALKPAERILLARLAPRLAELEMLDIGVGAGRTGYTFAPLMRRYVGIDYAPRMVERAKELLGGDPAVTILLADARDLSEVGGPFDLVLFSFNGIDAVGHEARRRILAQVRRVMRPGGEFLFSSHSLGALPLTKRKERDPRLMRSRLYRVYARLDGVRHGRRVARVNARLDLRAARERGWVIVPGRGQGFAVSDYYVDPEYQRGQLTEAGLELIALYDVAGKEVELPYRGRDPWLDYLCRAA